MQNYYFIEVPGIESTETGEEAIFEKIINEIFPELKKDMCIHI